MVQAQSNSFKIQHIKLKWKLYADIGDSIYCEIEYCQRHIQDSVKHLGWNILQKWLTTEYLELFLQKATYEMFDWVLNMSLIIHGLFYYCQLKLPLRTFQVSY